MIALLKLTHFFSLLVLRSSLYYGRYMKKGISGADDNPKKPY